jgi:hypothetical protein
VTHVPNPLTPRGKKDRIDALASSETPALSST